MGTSISILQRCSPRWGVVKTRSLQNQSVLVLCENIPFLLYYRSRFSKPSISLDVLFDFFTAAPNETINSEAKKVTTTKSPLWRLLKLPARETTFVKKYENTSTREQLRTRALPTIIYYKDTIPFKRHDNDYDNN